MHRLFQGLGSLAEGIVRRVDIALRMYHVWTSSAAYIATQTQAGAGQHHCLQSWYDRQPADSTEWCVSSSVHEAEVQCTEIGGGVIAAGAMQAAAAVVHRPHAQRVEGRPTGRAAKLRPRCQGIVAEGRQVT